MNKILFILPLIICINFPGWAQNLKGGGEANPQLLTNPASLENWRALKFGMFIHWGPVAQKGTEIGWSRGREVPFEEYDNLYKTFNPVYFDAREWISLIKEAGMKYLIFVSKHHDGFVMWDSKTTDYDVMSTPYGRDIMKELSEECRKQGILFGTYYSICDWRHPDYPVEQNNPERRTGADMNRYIAYMKAQLKEIVTDYHSKIIWFDGEWEEPWTHEMGMDLYQYLRNLDDEILINNRVDKGRKGMEGISVSNKYAGDFATPEQQVGRFDTLTPWESCITICTQWAWKPEDQLKSLDECLTTLIRTTGGDGNLLLNVGPMPDGRIEKRQADRLREIGRWLDKYGETIYGTRGGPLTSQPDLVCTQNSDKMYLHLLQPTDTLILKDLDKHIERITLFGEKRELAFNNEGDDLRIHLPLLEEKLTDQILTISLKK